MKNPFDRCLCGHHRCNHRPLALDQRGECSECRECPEYRRAPGQHNPAVKRHHAPHGPKPRGYKP